MKPKGAGPRPNKKEKAERSGKNYLLAIAIDQYRHGPRLYNCVRDVKRLIDVLTKKYQFEKEHTFTLFDALATEVNILAAFKKLIPLVTSQDNLLVVYSGHGEYEKEIDEGYWIPVDAQFGQSGDYISNSRITKYIKAIPSHHTLFIVDSCFSGSLFASRNLHSPAANVRLDNIASRWLITAGRNEIVSDGKPGDHSPFADNIIYFLEKNTTSSLSVTSLIQQVIYAVAYNARQTPRGEPLQDVGHRGGQFYFHFKGIRPQSLPAEETDRSNPPPPQPGFFQTYRNDLTLVTAALVLILAIFIIAKRTDRSKEPNIEKTELLALQYAQVAHDSLFTLGRKAFQKEEFPEAKKHFQNALKASQGFTIDVSQTQTALAACNERIEQSTKPETPEKAKNSPPRTSNEVNASVSKEEQAWKKASDADEESAYRAYLKVFPDGKYAQEARENIADLYTYRMIIPFSISADQVLKLSLLQGKPPYQVRIKDRKTGKTLEKTFNEKGHYELSLKTLKKDGAGARMLMLNVTDGNFKIYKNPIPFSD